jgi:hypothetical protein
MDASSSSRRRAARLAGAAVGAALVAGGVGYAWLEAQRPAAITAAAPPAVPPAPVARVAPAPAPARPRSAEFGTVIPGADVRRVADWAVATADNGRRPFAIVDKTQARVYVFDPAGRLIADSTILIGLARGDDSEPGIGDKPIAAIRPDERTTPAGRFDAQPGKNLGGDNVIWVDYDAAVSMHAVRPIVASEHRLERMKSPDPAQHRISYGCINLPKVFFTDVAWPRFSVAGGMIYVLPETRPLAEVFPALRGTPVPSAG